MISFVISSEFASKAQSQQGQVPLNLKMQENFSVDTYRTRAHTFKDSSILCQQHFLVKNQQK